LSVRATD